MEDSDDDDTDRDDGHDSNDGMSGNRCMRVDGTRQVQDRTQNERENRNRTAGSSRPLRRAAATVVAVVAPVARRRRGRALGAGAGRRARGGVDDDLALRRQALRVRRVRARVAHPLGLRRRHARRGACHCGGDHRARAVAIRRERCERHARTGGVASQARAHAANGTRMWREHRRKLRARWVRWSAFHALADFGGVRCWLLTEGNR